jgi:hypothetical protein
VTTDALPTFSQYLAMKAMSKAKNRAKRTSEVSNRVPELMQAIVRLVLHIAGFGSLTFAGFTWNMTAGMVIAGISCFALSWLTTGTSDHAETGNAPDMRTGR